MRREAATGELMLYAKKRDSSVSSEATVVPLKAHDSAIT